MSDGNRVVVIGPFPPPVGGAAKNTQIIFEALQAEGCRAVKAATSIGQLSHVRGAAYHLKRLGRNLAVLGQIVRLGISRRIDAYMVPDGGLGLWYSLVHIIAIRALFRRLVLHHRTYQYIDGPSAAMRLIARLTRRRAVHVFLSDGMAAAFQRRYGEVSAMVSPNAHFADSSDSPTEVVPREASDGLVIGHLSNLSRDKGFFLVAETFDAVAEANPNARLELAGPIEEDAVAARLDELSARHPGRVTHHGPLYGAEKTAFYAGLDVFLFPTLFRQEAQPNVVYEARAAGVPVIATRRGCIAEMIGDGDGIVVETPERYAGAATEFLGALKSEPDRDAQRAAIRSRFEAEFAQSARAYRQLIDMLARRDGRHENA